MSNKPLIVFQSPIATLSGYGARSRDLLKALYEMDKYDVKVVPTKWGSTPQDQINPDTEFGQWVLNNVITSLNRKPDIYIQVTVPNEFRRMGDYNIGITAGIESTVASGDFIEGCNRMDLVLTSSTFSKQVLESTVLTQMNKQTRQKVGEIKLQTKTDVLFEGIDIDVYNKPTIKTDILDHVKEDFNFLMVGHWLQGAKGEDRKDVGMVIETFITLFKSLPKEKQPGLILKTSRAGFSIGERQKILEKIENITNKFGEKAPSVYLIFGDLSNQQMTSLYHHDKVKAMTIFTKGEGYGRPLAEFALTGKPILVSKWSGHTDFLPEENTVYLDGELTEIHKSAQNKFLIEGAKWFTVDYSKAGNKLWDVYNNYDDHLKRSKPLSSHIKKNFSLDKMTERFDEILSEVHVPKKVELDLPQIEKL